jgi:hypothetical protein
MVTMMVVAAAWMQLTCDVGGFGKGSPFEFKKIVTGKILKVYCNNDHGCGVGVGVMESESERNFYVESVKCTDSRLRPQSKIITRYSKSRALIATITIRLILEYRL